MELTIRQALARANKIDKQVDREVRRREKNFSKKTEQWQQSFAGERYREKTQELANLSDDLANMLSSWNIKYR